MLSSLYRWSKLASYEDKRSQTSLIFKRFSISVFQQDDNIDHNSSGISLASVRLGFRPFIISSTARPALCVWNGGWSVRISSAVIANDQMSHSFVRKSASKVSGAAYLATCENPADHSRPKFSKTWKRPAPLTTARLSSVIKTLDCHASSNSKYSFFLSLSFTTHWSQISVDNMLPVNIAYTLCNIRHLLQNKSYVSPFV